MNEDHAGNDGDEQGVQAEAAEPLYGAKEPHESDALVEALKKTAQDLADLSGLRLVDHGSAMFEFVTGDGRSFELSIAIDGSLPEAVAQNVLRQGFSNGRLEFAG